MVNIKFVEEFRLDLELRQLRKHTQESYISNVNHFLRYNPDPRNVGRNELKRYLDILLNNDLADSTLKSYFISVNALYEWMKYEGMVKENPIPPFRKRYLPRRSVKEKRQDISVDDAKRILKRMGHILDLAIHTVYAKTGMRRAELFELKVQDLKLDKWQINGPITGKRIDYRPLFLDIETMDIMLDYLDWRDEYATSDYLFISRTSGQKINKDYPGSALRKIGGELGIHKTDGALEEKLTPHCWRRFFTTQLHRAGMDPEYIKYLRGDVMEQEAWQIYNAIDPEDVRFEYLEKIPKLFA